MHDPEKHETSDKVMRIPRVLSLNSGAMQRGRRSNAPASADHGSQRNASIAIAVSIGRVTMNRWPLSIICSRAFGMSRAPDRSEQITIKFRSPSDLAARDQRKQCPIRACKQKERHCTQQRCTQMPVVPRVAETGTNGAVEPLDRQVLRSPLRRMPPQQSADHAEIADCVEPERRRDSHFGDHHAAQRRTDRAAAIDADAVRGHRLIQVLLGNELRNDRLPSGGCQCAGHTGEKCEQNRLAGVARPNQTIAAKIADIKVYADSLTMRNLRTSRMSASAP